MSDSTLSRWADAISTDFARLVAATGAKTAHEVGALVYEQKLLGKLPEPKAEEFSRAFGISSKEYRYCYLAFLELDYHKRSHVTLDVLCGKLNLHMGQKLGLHFCRKILASLSKDRTGHEIEDGSQNFNFVELYRVFRRVEESFGDYRVFYSTALSRLFQHIDKFHRKELTLEDIGRTMRSTILLKTIDFKRFLSRFPKNKDGKITEAEWLHYFISEVDGMCRYCDSCLSSRKADTEETYLIIRQWMLFAAFCHSLVSDQNGEETSDYLKCVTLIRHAESQANYAHTKHGNCRGIFNPALSDQVSIYLSF